MRLVCFFIYFTSIIYLLLPFVFTFTAAVLLQRQRDDGPAAELDRGRGVVLGANLDTKHLHRERAQGSEIFILYVLRS